MQNKILFISNTAIFSRFNLPYMRWFKQYGWQVDYVSAGEMEIPNCDNQYTIPIKRSPYSLKNIIAYMKLKEILQNDYDIIHCHSPMGGVLARLAAKKSKTKAKVIYTAHGFHFYKGSPLINWLIYYSVEKYFMKYTDILVTINNEDHNLAKKHFFSCKNIYKIDGVGVSLDRFKLCDEKDKGLLRKDFGINGINFVILYVAEFIPRKNHKLFIEHINILNEKIRHLKVFFVGTGPLLDKYKNQVRAMGLTNTVQFLGYRYDVEKLCNIADIGVSTSEQEGLPIGLVEYLASGLPVVCSKIRGHVDVITDRQNGLLFDLDEPSKMIDSILELYDNKKLKNLITENNLIAREKYSLDIAVAKMAEIYEQCI